jgi:AmmeMemoRadiSam system protein B
VQLPFLQYQEKDFDFVPIVIAPASVDNYRQIGAAIARALKDIKKETSSLIIASSDMTHYESHDSAKEKDAFVIDAIKALDEELLVKAIAKHDISMCGYAPTAVMICAAKELGADTARLIEYRTSAEASGDYSSVVGYAGIVVAKRERN